MGTVCPWGILNRERVKQQTLCVCVCETHLDFTGPRTKCCTEEEFISCVHSRALKACNKLKQVRYSHEILSIICRHCKPALGESTSIMCYCSLEPSSAVHKNKPVSICLLFFFLITDHSKCDFIGGD